MKKTKHLLAVVLSAIVLIGSVPVYAEPEENGYSSIENTEAESEKESETIVAEKATDERSESESDINIITDDVLETETEINETEQKNQIIESEEAESAESVNIELYVANNMSIDEIVAVNDLVNQIRNELEVYKTPFTESKDYQLSNINVKISDNDSDEIKELKQQLIDAQNKYNQAVLRYDDGLYGFYEWQISEGINVTSATNAIYILDHCLYSMYNERGVQGDATDLDNVRQLEYYMQEGELLRQRDDTNTGRFTTSGLQERAHLLTNNEIMAQAAANANASQITSYHTGQFSSAEGNLGWGQGDPYNGFYLMERLGMYETDGHYRTMMMYTCDIHGIGHSTKSEKPNAECWTDILTGTGSLSLSDISDDKSETAQSTYYGYSDIMEMSDWFTLLYRYIGIVESDIDIAKEKMTSVQDKIKKASACDEKGHQYDEGVTVKNATCSEEGTMKYTCIICSHEKYENIPLNEHSFDAGVYIIEPTCCKGGVINHCCKMCGKIWSEDVGPTYDHIFDEPTIEAATCYSEGRKIYVCKICHDYKCDVLPLAPHTGDADDCTSKAECEVCGKVYENGFGHDYEEIATSESSCFEYGSRVEVCKRCGDRRTIILPRSHCYNDGVITIKPCCNSEGVKTYTCERCGIKRTASIAVDPTAHDYVEKEVVNSTCSKEGMLIEICKLCGDEKKKVIEPAHTYDGGVVTREAKCDVIGEKRYTCSICGHIKFEQIPSPKHRLQTKMHLSCTSEGARVAKCQDCTYQEIYHIIHDFDEENLEIIKAATCTERGTARAKCKNCDATQDRIISFSPHFANEATCDSASICSICHKVVEYRLAHDYQLIEEILPSCADEGVKIYKCVLCNDIKTEIVGQKLSVHNYGDPDIKEPTCDEDGSLIYTCVACDSVKVEPLQKKGHSIVPASCIEPSICTNCNKEIEKPLGHTGGEATCTKKAVCTRCGDVYGEVNSMHHINTEVRDQKKATSAEDGYTGDTYCPDCESLIEKGKVIPKNEHIFVDYVSNNDATCTTDGTKTAKCEECDATDTVPDEGTKLGHTGGIATCTVLAKCERCHEPYGTVNQTNHVNTEIRNQKSATYTEDGYTGDIYCSECGELISEGTVITKTTCAHVNTVLVDEKNATCIETGYTGDTYCNDCKQTIKKGEIIPKAAHIFENYVSNEDATCTVDGTKSAKCKNCDATDTKTDKGTALGHEGGIATCITQAICTRCDQLYGEFDLTNHSYAKKVLVKATLTKPGTMQYTCKDCKQPDPDRNVMIIYCPTTFTLSKNEYVYDGTMKAPKLTIYDSKGKVIDAKYYTFTKDDGRRFVGTYNYTIKFRNKYTGTKTISFKINPKSTTLASVTAGIGKMDIKWNKLTTQTTGYQIQYSTSSSFASGNKTVAVSNNTTTSKSITGLTKGKKYYVRIRTYKTVGSTKYYSAWSAKKYATIK